MHITFDGPVTTITLSDGKTITAAPQDNDDYRARAEALGYGDDTERMSREHEVCHALLCQWIGLRESPTLRGVADGQYWPHWRDEEAAVLALQKLLNTLQIDPMDLLAIDLRDA